MTSDSTSASTSAGSAVPSPGTQQQLEELIARLQERQLDRHKPLWEIIVIDGLEGGRIAVVTKVHQALVDGVQGLDLGQVVLDDSPTVHDPPPDSWRPAPEPTAWPSWSRTRCWTRSGAQVT